MKVQSALEIRYPGSSAKTIVNRWKLQFVKGTKEEKQASMAPANACDAGKLGSRIC
jgi:hypothetical protein